MAADDRTAVAGAQPARSQPDVRLTVVRAAVVIGAFGVGSVEVLSAVGWLTTAGAAAVWALAASAVVGRRTFTRRRHAPTVPGGPGLRHRWRSLARVDRLVVASIGVLVAAELVLALGSPPNTYDSQTYHLPRIEQWVRQGSVEFFPTGIHRQITYPPGAEFLLLHLRLLTGSDALYNLLQWSAGVLCLVVVTRICAQLGGSRRAQLLSALVTASVPMVVLQSSSTQTDLVVAAWVGCVVTLALDGVGREPRRSPGAGTVLLIGAATGLVAVTKATGGLLAGPLLVWWALAQLHRARSGPGPARARSGPGPVRAGSGRLPGRLAWAGVQVVAVAVVALALAGPQFARVTRTFGHPLGPPALSASLTLQRHDPGSLLINLLRDAHTAFEVPLPPVNRWTGDRIVDLAGAIGVDPSDPRTTFYHQTFPGESWYPHEDKAALPLHGLLLMIGVGAALARRRNLRYVGALAVAAVAYAVIFKWQPWGNRLLLFLVVGAAPLAGLWLDRVLDLRRWRAVVVGALVVATLAGGLTAAYGYPRRLVGGGSVFAQDELAARFTVRPKWREKFTRAADAVNAAGARRVGIAATNDGWEYPWYVLLDATDVRSVQSTSPDILPPATPDDLDAVVCAGPAWFCYQFAPPSWAFTDLDGVTYAIRPRT